MSALEELLLTAIHANGLPEPMREYRFAPPRRWRFDFAWPDRLLAVEVEGGTWAGGRHTRGSGFRADCEKYDEAALLGWRVLRFTGDMITEGYAVRSVAAFLDDNPGTDGARRRGCICPHDQPEREAGLYWMTEDCPVHGRFWQETLPDSNTPNGGC